MMAGYRCIDANTKLDIKSRYKESKSHELEIKLYVSYSRTIWNWNHHDSTALPEPMGPGLFWNYQHDASAALVGKSLSRQNLRDAVRISIGCYFRVANIDRLADLAWECVCRTLNPDSLPTNGVLVLSCNIHSIHNHYYSVESDTRIMVPAAPSSFQLLEKCEANCGGACCSICLDEFGGAVAAARMPCSHVFHGGCIEKWLRKSHYCPLCRYRMPTATE